MMDISSTEAELRQQGRDFSADQRKRAADRGAALPDGSFPIMNQTDLNNAVRLMGKAKNPARARAHIIKRARQLGLKLPDSFRQKAAVNSAANRPHGFAWPQDMPECGMCGYPANSPVHVNPAISNALRPAYGEQIIRSASGPMRAHAYTAAHSGSTASVRCQLCGQVMASPVHTVGMPSRMVAAEDGAKLGKIVLTKHDFVALEGQSSTGEPYKMCAHCGFPEDNALHRDGPTADDVVLVDQRVGASQGAPAPAEVRAFVAQRNGKLILAAPASTFSDASALPRELASAWEQASAGNPAFLWLQGRFVEADRPNRNQAVWSTEDLELANPTVAHGPVNWLHDERHIIGTIADAALLKTERQAAGEGELGNHIVAMAALWPYIFPAEAMAVVRASEEQKLWYSMECISSEVACLSDGCSHQMSYRDFMLTPAKQCAHMQANEPRRFIQPRFLGGAVIIPPLRPGWANANAKVMTRASILAERQAASFQGMTTTEAELLVAQVLDYAGGTDE